MCALPSRFIKERNKVSNASAYCRKHQRVWHGWFQNWLIVEGISVKADKTRKESRGRAQVKESQRKSKEMMPSVDLPNYIKRMGKPQSLWKVGLPASDKHYWLTISLNSSSSGDLSLFLDIFVFSCQTSKFKLLTTRFTHHPHYQSTHRTTSACVLLHN